MTMYKFEYIFLLLCRHLGGNLTLDFINPTNGTKGDNAALLYLSDLQDGMAKAPFDLIDAKFALDAQLRIIILRSLVD